VCVCVCVCMHARERWPAPFLPNPPTTPQPPAPDLATPGPTTPTGREIDELIQLQVVPEIEYSRVALEHVDLGRQVLPRNVLPATQGTQIP